MDIIKFRGKIKDKKRAKELNLKVGDWVYGYYFHDEGLQFINGKSKEFSRHYIINTPYPEEWIEVIPESVGQFTGLYDKNGKEIYDGDIVKFNLKSDSKGQPDIIGYIEYQTTFCAYRIMSFKGSFALDYNIKDIEVIGNIYDNKNLLEEE